MLPLAVLIAGIAMAPPPAPSVTADATPGLQAVDAGFVCPEAMRSDVERTTALHSYFDAFARARPAATPADAIAFRRVLLQKHGCTLTLEQVDAADRAVAAGDVRQQAWLDLSNRDGVALAVSTNHLLVVLDLRFADERTVDGYARLTLAQPATTEATRVRYDEVISHAVYYCRTRRYALAENVFYLAGREVGRDMGAIVARSADGAPLFAVADLPPGSYNAEAGQWACRNARGSAT